MVLQLLHYCTKSSLSHPALAAGSLVFWLMFLLFKMQPVTRKARKKINHTSEGELQLLGHHYNKFIFHFHNTTLLLPLLLPGQEKPLIPKAHYYLKELPCIRKHEGCGKLQKSQLFCHRLMTSEQLKEFIDKPTEDEWTRMKEAGFMTY